MPYVNATTLGKVVEKALEGDIEGVKNYVGLIIFNLEADQDNELAIKILKSKLDGSYKQMNKVR